MTEHAYRQRRRTQGVGLAELMVALAVGLLVTLAAAAMLLVANTDFRHNSAHARLDDGGRYALELAGAALRQAAWADLEAGMAPAPDDEASVAGLDAASLDRTSPGLSGVRPAVNGSDVLALRFAGSGSGGGDGSVLDCAGFAVGEGDRAWSIFYVATGDDGETELRCKYRGDSGNWSADAIVRGVDSFQVLYGVDLDSPRDGVPNRYLNASGIDGLDAALVLAGATEAERAQDLRRRTHWKRIVAVRMALLLHGESGSRAGSRPVRFDLFGQPLRGDEGTTIDEAALPEPLRLRARRVFESAVLLRNGEG